MLLPFLCIIGCWVIFNLIARNLYKSKCEMREMGWSFTFTFGTICGLVLWLFVGLVIIDKVTTTTYKYKETRIVSIKNDSQLHGDFFLGTGSIGETEYYFYFKKIYGGRYERGKIRTDDAVIEETNNKRPCIAIPYEVEFIKKSSLKHSKLWFLNADDKTFIYSNPSYHGKRIIYVPVGTILTNFELH